MQDFVFKSQWILLLSLVWGAIASAQDSDAPPPTVTAGSVQYISPVDELLNVQSFLVLPTIDNVGGIYAQSVETEIKNIIDKDHRFQLRSQKTLGAIPAPEELVLDPEKVKAMGSSLAADAIVSSQVVKGPQGLYVHIRLFLTRDGQLIAQQVEKKLAQFESSTIVRKTGELVHALLAQLPYDGQILSRQGERITINLGLNNGVKPNQKVAVIQLVQIKRHPKFHFLLSTTKQVLGYVKLLKVEDRLSFGAIESEVEANVIQPGAKVQLYEAVQYSGHDYTQKGAVDISEFKQRPDADVAFGDQPQEWRPDPTPSFGMLGVRAGLGQFQRKMKLVTTNGDENLDADDMFYPQLSLFGEAWVTSTWSLGLNLRQAIINTANPRSESSPGELAHSLMSYSFEVGYHFRLSEAGVWGGDVALLFGLSQYNLFVDDSDPQGFTTMKYSGLHFGLGGQYPIMTDWLLGGKLLFFWEPTLSEAPVSSGSSSENRINIFGISGIHKLSNQLRLEFGLDFELYSTSFSGVGSRSNGDYATSASLTHISANSSLAYLF